MIGVIDYGVGNLFSLCCSLRYIGQEVAVSSDPAELATADHIILPGVGAFADAADRLRESGLWDFVLHSAQQGKPLLGICLGMQLLFERSYEYGRHEGLGLIPGEIRPIADDLPKGSTLKVPQMGWNALNIKKQDRLFANTREGDCFYYVHSYYGAKCDENILATSEYGIDITGVVGKDNVRGVQFHPEKSGQAGLSLLDAFAKL